MRPFGCLRNAVVEEISQGTVDFPSRLRPQSVHQRTGKLQWIVGQGQNGPGFGLGLALLTLFWFLAFCQALLHRLFQAVAVLLGCQSNDFLLAKPRFWVQDFLFYFRTGRGGNFIDGGGILGVAANRGGRHIVLLGQHFGGSLRLLTLSSRPFAPAIATVGLLLGVVQLSAAIAGPLRRQIPPSKLVSNDPPDGSITVFQVHLDDSVGNIVFRTQLVTKMAFK